MRAVPLNDETTADLHFQQAGERDPGANIAAEVAVRLIELSEEVGPLRAAQLVTKLAAVWSVSPEGFWLTMRLLTGDLSALTISYAELGKANARTKQGQEQAELRALIAIQRNFPHLAAALVELRRTTAEIQDREL